MTKSEVTSDQRALKETLNVRKKQKPKSNVVFDVVVVVS